MKRTVAILSLEDLNRTLNRIQFPATIEISYVIRKSQRYKLREDLNERYDFLECEGAWCFQSNENFFDPLNVGDIGKMALQLHTDVKLEINELSKEEYIELVLRRKGMIRDADGLRLATRDDISRKYHAIKGTSALKKEFV